MCDSTGIYHSTGKCLSNGRCLCWWGWTGSGACYVYGGAYNNRIIVSVNLIECRPSKTNKQTNKHTNKHKIKTINKCNCMELTYKTHNLWLFIVKFFHQKLLSILGSVYSGERKLSISYFL